MAVESINLSALAANLGAYCMDNTPRIFQNTLIGMEKLFAGDGITVLDGITDQAPLVNFTAGALVQNFDNKSWNPSTNLGFKDRVMSLKKYKVDLEVGAEDFRSSYLAHIRKTNGMMRDVADIPMYEHMINVIANRVSKDLYNATWNGEYVANTIGTPDVAPSPLKIMDGFIKLFDTSVTAGDLVPVATGALTSANILTAFENVANELGSFTIEGSGVMYVSRKAYRMYIQALKNSGHLALFSAAEKPQLFVFGTDVVLQENPAFDMAGKFNAIVATVFNNMFVGTDSFSSNNMITVEKYRRSISIMIEGVIGAQYAQADNEHKQIVINDQVV